MKQCLTPSMIYLNFVHIIRRSKFLIKFSFHSMNFGFITVKFLRLKWRITENLHKIFVKFLELSQTECKIQT